MTATRVRSFERYERSFFREVAIVSCLSVDGRVRDDQILERCCTTGVIGLVVIYFTARMPLLRIFVYGITISTNGRALLHTVKVVPAMLIIALFFQVMGRASRLTATRVRSFRAVRAFAL